MGPYVLAEKRTAIFVVSYALIFSSVTVSLHMFDQTADVVEDWGEALGALNCNGFPKAITSSGTSLITTLLGPTRISDLTFAC